ncbi:hypothetical protein FRB98_003720 [Tulasnella sp. 332]|nr:hypothetical protein FRB98_003720 [Tulasnella sp. 332]
MSNLHSAIPYARLGSSSLKVSRVILGCMSYGSSNWQNWVLDEKEGIEHIKLAYDLGINAFDTSNTYSNGLSEVVLGKAIKQHKLPREEIIIMTKHIFDSIKHSLERIQLDYVDLLQCHRFDYDTPIEETMHALHDVVKAGYARYIGMSSCYAWQFHKMQNYARTHGLTEFISMQNSYSAIYREEEREMVPLLQDLGVGMMPYSPLARGFLARPISKDSDTARGQTDVTRKPSIGDPEKMTFLSTINERVASIASARSVSMAQVALAWSLSKPFVTAPIIGTTSAEKLRDLCAGVHLKLTEDEIKSIDDPYEPRRVAGHA